MRILGKELKFNNNKVYHAGDKPTPSEIGASPSNHNHDSVYLRKTGDTMTGALKSSLSSGTWLAGNQGNAIVSSIATAGAYTALVRYPSTGGVFTLSGYQNKLHLNYTDNATIEAGTNTTTKAAILLDESGNSNFPGTITAKGFSGNASTATKLQTARAINGVAFDGTKDITVPVESHNHDSVYFKLAGGTVTGTTTLSNTVLIKSKAEGDTSSITFRDANNNTVMYLGRSTGTNNIFRIVNSISGGDISFGTTGGGDMVFSTGQFRLGSATSKTYRCLEVERLCATGATEKARKVRYGLNDVEGGSAGIELHEDGNLISYLHLGPTFFRPSPNGAINLGTSGQKWKDAHLSGTIYTGSVKLMNTSYPGLRFSDNVRLEYDVANDNLYVAGTKSQSGGLRPFQATICDSTSHAKIAGKKVFVQSGTPSGVATGDVWIQI